VEGDLGRAVAAVARAADEAGGETGDGDDRCPDTGAAARRNGSGMAAPSSVRHVVVSPVSRSCGVITRRAGSSALTDSRFRVYIY
jgi:hypothetical protein